MCPCNPNPYVLRVTVREPVAHWPPGLQAVALATCVLAGIIAQSAPPATSMTSRRITRLKRCMFDLTQPRRLGDMTCGCRSGAAAFNGHGAATYQRQANLVQPASEEFGLTGVASGY